MSDQSSRKCEACGEPMGRRESPLPVFAGHNGEPLDMGVDVKYVCRKRDCARFGQPVR